MRKVASFFFLATIFCCTFEKVHWNFGGNISLADVLALGFIGCFCIVSRSRVPATTAVLLGFFAAFLIVDLAGFYNLETAQALAQFGKGLGKWLIHFLFLATAVAWLYRRGQAYYWRTLAWFTAGMVVNGIYGLLELVSAQAGHNLDSTVLSPLTGGASQINIYGGVNGSSVFRPNAFTGDPNHLGIMLIVPLLVLTPIYLRMEPSNRLRRWLIATIVFLLIVEAATLSRSGLLGLVCGVIVLAVPYRRYFYSRQLLVPVGAALVVLGIVFVSRLHFFTVVLRSRLETHGGSENAHLHVYSFIPAVIHTHPLFGLGLNTFSVYYQFVTGKTNWGPHSYYVALIVESGLVGATLFAVFLLWVFRRLGRARALGRMLDKRRNPLGARVRPLAWGLTAALVGTIAANAFYLTMQFYYFYAFLALALAVPIVFATAQRESPNGSGTASSDLNTGTSLS
jgi:O-Antigen ligase